MCDTDDTDDLLLIPPDFFVIDSDSGHSNIVEPYYNIVDGLIQQVSKLQNRIQSIESLNNSFDHPDNMHHSSSGFRKYNSIDDLYIAPNVRTPQKHHGKFKINSLPASPNVDRFSSPGNNPRINREFRSPSKTNASPKNTKRSSPNISPAKDDGKMFNEIDTFLSKVKVIQRINAARNLEKEFNDGDITRKDKNSAEVDKLLADFDRQQQKIESVSSDVNFKRDSGLLNKEPTVIKEKAWGQGENKESVPDYGAGAREMLYKDYKGAGKPKGDFKKQAKVENDSATTNDSWISIDKYSDSSSDSTQLTAYNKHKKGRTDLINSPLHSNALNVLHMHKQLLEADALKANAKNKRERKPREANIVSDTLGLLSLADIWSKNTQLLLSNPSQLSQKVQEEKLRRQHCEELIQELQNRNLELQQKLSVAVKVDDSKNNTIHQFQEALEKILDRLEKVNSEKLGWDQQMTRLKTRHAQELEEVTQKVEFYEKEASKALNLAHGNQEKLSSLERRSSGLQEELQSIEQKCKDLQADYSKEVERNKELSDMLSRKETEINENKNILNDARTEVAQTKRAVEVCQAEFASMKAEYAKLQNELRQERDQIKHLNEQKKMLVKEVEAYKRREEDLKEELGRTRKQLESNKLELRNYYQGQVEILVQNKLTEFQAQLDRAEGTYKEETKKREMSIAKTAATHIQQISDKYSLEIKLLEKKHQEEIKLYQIQVMQHKQQVEALQGKLDQLHEKRIHIAKQLQRIMESQWTEALRIITSGKSPTFNDQAFNTIDQLNSLKTKSYNNVEEVLAQQQEEQYNIARKKNETHMSMPNDETMSSISNNYEKHPQDMYSLPMDTPVSSRGQGGKQYNENEVQKYINLLLNRPPGNPTQESHHRESGKTSPENANDRVCWQHGQGHQEDTNKSSKGTQRDNRFPKPPWK